MLLHKNGPNILLKTYSLNFVTKNNFGDNGRLKDICLLDSNNGEKKFNII